MAAMFVVAPLINRVDNRLIILFGFLLTAVSMWQMSQFSLQMGMAPVIISGLLQGFGLGCTLVPLNIIALSTLPRHILTQGTAIRSLMRNLGGSIGISILVATLAENTQVVHSRLVEGLRPDNPLAQAPYLAAPFSLTTPSGIAALNAEVTRQAAMVAYIDDFKLMMLIALASLPLLLLLREARRRPPPAAAIQPRRPTTSRFRSYPGQGRRSLRQLGQGAWRRYGMATGGSPSGTFSVKVNSRARRPSLGVVCHAIKAVSEIKKLTRNLRRVGAPSKKPDLCRLAAIILGSW